MSIWLWIALTGCMLGVGALALSRRARHAAGTIALLARDPRVPRPVRWLMVLALLPIPGPLEEIAGGLAVAYIARRLPAVWADHAKRGRDHGTR